MPRERWGIGLLSCMLRMVRAHSKDMIDKRSHLAHFASSVLPDVVTRAGRVRLKPFKSLLTKAVA